MDIIARRVADYEHLENPGDYIVYDEENVKQITFLCPCGCGDLGSVNINQSDPYCWKWNGDKDKPTTTPSIKQLSCGWHGYLTDGIFKTV
jgi:hypothetical protein